MLCRALLPRAPGPDGPAPAPRAGAAPLGRPASPRPPAGTGPSPGRPCPLSPLPPAGAHPLPCVGAPRAWVWVPLVVPPPCGDVGRQLPRRAGGGSRPGVSATNRAPPGPAPPVGTLRCQQVGLAARLRVVAPLAYPSGALSRWLAASFPPLPGPGPRAPGGPALRG